MAAHAGFAAILRDALAVARAPQDEVGDDDNRASARYIHVMPTDTKKPLNPFLKLALEMGPLMLFFVANFKPQLFSPVVGPLLPAALADGEHMGIFVATAVFMVAILITLVVSYSLTRHLPVMAMVTAVIVLVFGGLTLYLQNETFIKMKPTVIYVLFASVLFFGLIFDKPFLT